MASFVNFPFSSLVPAPAVATRFFGTANINFFSPIDQHLMLNICPIGPVASDYPNSIYASPSRYIEKTINVNPIRSALATPIPLPVTMPASDWVLDITSLHNLPWPSNTSFHDCIVQVKLGAPLELPVYYLGSGWIKDHPETMRHFVKAIGPIPSNREASVDYGTWDHARSRQYNPAHFQSLVQTIDRGYDNFIEAATLLRSSVELMATTVPSQATHQAFYQSGIVKTAVRAAVGGITLGGAPVS